MLLLLLFFVVVVIVDVGDVAVDDGVVPIELSSGARGHKQLCDASRATVPADGLAVMRSVIN